MAQDLTDPLVADHVVPLCVFLPFAMIFFVAFAGSRMFSWSTSIYSMYPRTMNTTLDAREILQAALQLEGLGPVAKNLSRSQSTISDAIGRLQEQLGVRLFEIHKRPDVQSEGQTLGALPGTVTVRPLSVNIHSYQVQ